MTHKKLFYTAPEADLLVIRFEENFVTSVGEPGNPGTPGLDILDPGSDFTFIF